MAIAQTDDRLYPPDDAARYLGVEKSTLDEWRYRRQGPNYVKLGHRTVRYRLSDLESYAQRRTVAPGPDAA